MGKFDEEGKSGDVLRIRNWQQFQHYRHRNPPWIKLHFSLISSSDWVMWDDASRVLAIVCMLLASKNDGVIHNNPDFIARVAYLNSVNLKPLIECGFLEHASTMLASDKHLRTNARPEESRGELEKEKRQRRSASALHSVDKFKSNNGQWWKSDAGIQAKGVELSIPAQRGESWADYKDRLFIAINSRKA